MNKLGLMLAAASLTLGVGIGQASAIEIATAGPMTGDYAAFGMQMQRGAEAAVADINAAGGVNGEMLSLHIGDDACDPKQATAVANEFVSQGVIFVAGHFCSGSSIPASDVYIEEAVLQISPRRSCAPAAATTSRAISPGRGSPRISPARTSPSCTTSRPTVRALPT